MPPTTSSTDTSAEAVQLFNEALPMTLEIVQPIPDLDQQFTLVSCEGCEISLPVYELMTWSNFFRGLLQAGSGQKRVQVEERAETLEQVKQVLRTGEVTWRERSDVPFFEQVFALVAFFDKYDCPRALKDIIDLLLRGVYIPDSNALHGVNRMIRQGDLPPLLLFAIGARLDRPDVCKAALNAPQGSWMFFKTWMHPPGIAGLTHRNTLHPLGIPHKLFCELPLDYTLALTLTKVKEVILIGEGKLYGLNGNEFLGNLVEFKAIAKRARRAGGGR